MVFSAILQMYDFYGLKSEVTFHCLHLTYFIVFQIMKLLILSCKEWNTVFLNVGPITVMFDKNVLWVFLILNYFTNPYLKSFE